MRVETENKVGIVFSIINIKLDMGIINNIKDE